MSILYGQMSPQLKYYYNKVRNKPKKERTQEQTKRRAEIQRKYNFIKTIKNNNYCFFGLDSMQ